jgi:hypothetical protein
MASSSRSKIEELRMIVWFSLGWVYWLASGHAPRPESCGMQRELALVRPLRVPPTCLS